MNPPDNGKLKKYLFRLVILPLQRIMENPINETNWSHEISLSGRLTVFSFHLKLQRIESQHL